ncbi:MAG TPA: PQQ-dependent sugar dehydrogenase, partial [Fibrobacteria bacterium]|nr:PQQ-dependent sugar dehydrogenase [Fibrobacteria bacterium]
IPLPPEFPDHNGGAVLFGRDGFLYLGVGDGGWDMKSPDIHNNGQNRKVLAGKILRIDVDRKDPGLEYAIPADNPFVNDPDPQVRREIFAYGLRNPYRMSMDRVTGEIYVADVGLVNFEKVLILKSGANYGWKLQEHTLCFTPGTCSGITVEPVAGYMPYGQVKCFIGGHVYRGDPSSPFYGVYLFGDHTMKRLLAFKKGSAPVLVTDLNATPTEMTSFTVDSQNNFYMVGYRGTIYKLIHNDLKPYASSLRPLARGRARIRAGIWDGRSTAPGAIFSLDGSRLGTLGPDGSLEGKAHSLPTGLFLSVPD